MFFFVLVMNCKDCNGTIIFDELFICRECGAIQSKNSL